MRRTSGNRFRDLATWKQCRRHLLESHNFVPNALTSANTPGTSNLYTGAGDCPSLTSPGVTGTESSDADLDNEFSNAEVFEDMSVDSTTLQINKSVLKLFTKLYSDPKLSRNFVQTLLTPLRLFEIAL